MKLLYFAIYQIMINDILHLHVPSISKEQSTHSSLPASLLPLKRKTLLSIIEKPEFFRTDPQGGHLYFKNWAHAEHVLYYHQRQRGQNGYYKSVQTFFV